MLNEAPNGICSTTLGTTSYKTTLLVEITKSPKMLTKSDEIQGYLYAFPISYFYLVCSNRV